MDKENDPYFIAIDDNETMEVPDSIQGDAQEEKKGFEFIESKTPDEGLIKLILLTVLALLVVMFSWQIYQTFIEIDAHSTWLALAFGFVVFILFVLLLKQAIIFKKGLLGFKKTERLRDQAEMLVKERTHGKAKAFIAELRAIYANKPQAMHLEKALNELPDYLNDAEVVARLSDDFLSHLDEEAKRLVVQESSISAAMVAVSQLVVIDSIIVIWRTIKMMNGISSIYGLSLTKLGQWYLFVKISKAIMLAGGTQMAINSVAGTMFKGHPFVGPMAANLTQGLGVGSYVAKIGVEAMKQSRPIALEDDEVPSVNLITDGVRGLLIKRFVGVEK